MPEGSLRIGAQEAIRSPQQVINRTKASKFPAGCKEISVRHFRYLRDRVWQTVSREWAGCSRLVAMRRLLPLDGAKYALLSAYRFDASMMAEHGGRTALRLIPGWREVLSVIPQSAAIAPF
jgi:hypothetical protein